MGGFGRWCFAVFVLSALSVAGCAAGKNEALLEQQQSLVRELTAKCDKGLKQECSRAEEERRTLYEVYGCHCKDSMPPEHKTVWSGG
jgi:outer membrane murein-binding lipoprotein Lpp